MKHANDAQILHKLLSGDDKTFSWFFRTHSKEIRNFLSHKIENHDDKEEIVQTTFIAFFEALRDYEGRSSLKTFLFSICRHKLIDYYRTKKTKALSFSTVPHVETILSTFLEPEHEYNEAVTKKKIQHAFAHILPLYREILLSKYSDGLGVSDIAKKLKLTFKSTEARLFRARKAFVTVFQQSHDRPEF